jgi:hypothetical protein
MKNMKSMENREQSTCPSITTVATTNHNERLFGIQSAN